jgi:hypothetical protein
VVVQVFWPGATDAAPTLLSGSYLNKGIFSLADSGDRTSGFVILKSDRAFPPMLSIKLMAGAGIELVTFLNSIDMDIVSSQPGRGHQKVTLSGTVAHGQGFLFTSHS